jgi:hypothetical protein
MKRLRDRIDPMTPLETSAISLLRSVNRYEPPTGFKQRVRTKMLASRSVSHPRLWHPAVAVALLLVAAGASATIGGTWVVRQYLTTKGGPHIRISKRKAPVLVPVTLAPAVAQSSMQQAPDVAVATPPTAASVNALGPAIDKQATLSATRSSSQSSEQVKLVFDSMRALRRDGQPERAAKLLDEYLRRYPNGALAEEALALSIEAATMRGDPRAKDLANRYLLRYPSGQFQHAAERARARFSP